MRLIDAEALKESIYKEKEKIQYNQPFIQASLILLEKLIKNVPAIEAKPVVHAHWFMFEYEYFSCSNCGVDIWNGCDSTAQAEQLLANKEVMFKYCPYCGAQMDEVVSE